MGSESRYLQFLGMQLDHMPDHFLRHSVAPYGSQAAHAAKQFARGNLSRRKPGVQELFHPVGNGNCPNVATLADKIDDRPAVFTSLEMVETEVGKLLSSETATEQDSNDRTVSLTFERFSVGRLPQSACFTHG